MPFRESPVSHVSLAVPWWFAIYTEFETLHILKFKTFVPVGNFSLYLRLCGDTMTGV
jgi:hypothetical protein